jgi:hypothetical protein
MNDEKDSESLNRYLIQRTQNTLHYCLERERCC